MDGGNGKAPTWPELLGSKKWEGLLDPLDLHLRQLILLSGDLTQAARDAFISDKHHKYFGRSRYGKRDFFTNVMFPFAADNYSVAGFLHATSEFDLPWDSWSESNFMGYIAVSSDASAAASGRREIYVTWRGVEGNIEVMDALLLDLVSIDPLLASSNDIGDKPKVMKGWYTIYTSSNANSLLTKTSARDQLLSKIRQLVQLYKNESLSIVCAGYSLGATLAILSALDLVENGLSKVDDKPEFPVCAIVFASPHVGNKAFNDRLEKLPGLRVLHIRNEGDIVPAYPPEFLGFVSTGVELVVDNGKSPYLKASHEDGANLHSLQAMLHTVAGWNGKDKDFEFKVERSLALVNKMTKYLKAESLIPESWWVEKNKGMVLLPNGDWQLAPPEDEEEEEEEEDTPVPPGS